MGQAHLSMTIHWGTCAYLKEELSPLLRDTRTISLLHQSKNIFLLVIFFFGIFFLLLRSIEGKC